MAVGIKLEARGRTVSPEIGLDLMDFAADGGSFPVRVRSAGFVAAITVSGLTSTEDHGLIIEAVASYLGVTAPKLEV